MVVGDGKPNEEFADSLTGYVGEDGALIVAATAADDYEG